MPLEFSNSRNEVRNRSFLKGSTGSQSRLDGFGVYAMLKEARWLKRECLTIVLLGSVAKGAATPEDGDVSSKIISRNLGHTETRLGQQVFFINYRQGQATFHAPINATSMIFRFLSKRNHSCSETLHRVATLKLQRAHSLLLKASSERIFWHDIGTGIAVESTR